MIRLTRTLLAAALLSACAIVVEEDTSSPGAAAPTTWTPVPATLELEPEFVAYPDGVLISTEEECSYGVSQMPPAAQAGSFRVGPSGLSAISGCGEKLSTKTVKLPPQVLPAALTTYGCYRLCVQRRDCPEPQIDPADPVRYRWDDYRRMRSAIGYLSAAEMRSFCASLADRLPTFAELQAAVSATPPTVSHRVLADLLACWLGGSPDKDRCARVNRQLPDSPGYRVAPVAHWPWHEGDAGQLAGKAGEDPPPGDNGSAHNLWGGVAERTATHIDRAAWCASPDVVDDVVDEKASEHVLWSPAADIKRAIDDGSFITQPEHVSDDYRSYRLGFRCAGFSW